MDNGEDPAEGVHTESDEALFASGFRVFDRHRERVAQRLLRVSEAHLVPAQIRRLVA